MPHFETFMITFNPSLSDDQGGLWQIPLSTRCTLPNLRWFGFEGRGAYMQVVLPRITMPLLRVTEILTMPVTFDLLGLTSDILFTLRSMYKTENPRLCNVKVTFYDVDVTVVMYPHQRTGMPIVRFDASWVDLDGILNFTARIFDEIRTVLTEVEMLTLEAKATSRLHERFEIRTGWHELLRPFNQVRTLQVSGSDLIERLSRSLQPHDGESAIELLPKLRVLSCPEGTIGDSCRSFLDARRNTGFPVTISHH